MKKLSLILLVVTLIAIFACDRFEHTFYTAPIPKITAEPLQGYVPLQVTFDDISIYGNLPIEEWIWDFDGDGIPDSTYTFQNKPDSIVHVFELPGTFTVSMTIDDGETTNSDTVIIEVLDINSPLANFTFTPQYGYIPLDVTFTDISTPGTNPITSWEWDFNDDGLIDSNDQNPYYAYNTAGDYLITLIVSDGIYESSYFKMITVLAKSVMIEMFTAISCVNCPTVEEALHNLRMQYGSRLSYVEYHINDILDPGNTPLLIYYENHGSLPYTVINGNAEIITGSSSTIQQDIEDIIIPLMEQPILAKLLDVQANINGTTLNGSVQIELDGSIPTDNLKLVAVLMEKLSTEHQNHNGDNLHNIEIKREVLDISSSGLHEFTIPDLDQLASGYQQLPEDLVLVLWIQTLEDPYNQDTCTIYNVIEKIIIR